MLRHLRLARARGSLTAPNNPVQDRALEALEVLDMVDREKSRLDRVKGLLTLTPSMEMVKAQFPEYFAPEDPFKDAVDEDGEFDIDAVDDSQIDWDMPTSTEDDEAISRWISQMETGSISAAEM